MSAHVCEAKLLPVLFVLRRELLEDLEQMKERHPPSTPRPTVRSDLDAVVIGADAKGAELSRGDAFAMAEPAGKDDASVGLAVLGKLANEIVKTANILASALLRRLRAWLR
jgi:hypothetical protein